MDYLLDTNIIIIYSRENKLAKNNIGESRQHKIKTLLGSIYKIGLEYSELISKYVIIDAFSQGKIKIEFFKTKT